MGRPGVATESILYLPALSGVLTLPLHGFQLELPNLTGVVLTTAQPWQKGLRVLMVPKPGLPQNNTSSPEPWLLVPRVTIRAACSGLISPDHPHPIKALTM